ncbi:class I SAM-dependent methyltransferase [Spirillospora sp. NPDC048911]|uniref:class I SAM-dependent methyltransferase n=1 Tax=Spirillospora sp. NPDC048911 TaxID=3364527 RepID=UPI0037166390
MTTQAKPKDNEYLFDNETDEAAKQLRLLSDLCDYQSVRALSDIAPAPGWRCWDVGAGGGTVAAWLADAVGPTGSVLATDIKPLHVPNRDNLEARQHDVRSEEPPGKFNLIHARLVLMHLPEREAVLEKLVSALEPGGVLVVSDWDFTNPDYLIAAPTEESAAAFRKFQKAIVGLAEHVGADSAWARRLPTAFHKAGLADVTTSGEISSWSGGSPGCLLHLSNTRQLEGPLTAVGMTAEDLDTLREALVHPDFNVWAFELITATGRKK